MAGKAARPSAMLQRLASTPAPIERTEEISTPTSAPVADAAMTRMSVDLDDDQFEFLTIYAMRRKVSKVEVMRALMAELRADPALAERVSERLPQRRRR